jgi:hypothetical protein
MEKLFVSRNYLNASHILNVPFHILDLHTESSRFTRFRFVRFRFNTT